MVKPPEIYINYPKLVDQAMRDIAKKLLKDVEVEGLKGDHYFLISFLTTYKSIVLSERLKQKYAQEMTIVLQHQYEDLHVTDNELMVKLSFDGITEKIVIPFDAFTAFVDPSTKFALQFNPNLVEKKIEAKVYKSTVAGKGTAEKSLDQKVLVLDNFRKK